ncbi:10888_t:CDS:2, partial [Cetraspora pellucida]
RECSQNTVSQALQNNVSQALQNNVSQASQVSINGDDNGESLQENFSDSESLFSDKSQHINDLKYNSSMASDTSSSSDQLLVTEEIELQTEEEKNFNQIIVNSRINFQPLPGEYGLYFKNFMEMSFFTWVTQHMIILRPQMYFGPGVEAETKEEFWHGDIWQQSPLFGLSSMDNEIRIGRIIAIDSTSSGIKLKVQFLYFGSELPKNFLSSARAERSRNGELWLSEIIAALGVVISNLSQGNDLADTKCHISNLGCRSCLVPKEQLSNLNFDVKLNS